MRSGTMMAAVCALAAALAAGGCERRGNLKTARDFHPPPAPAVASPLFDPYASPGEARAVWRPAVIDRRGTVIAPGRPDGPDPAKRLRPPGTF